MKIVRFKAAGKTHYDVIDGTHIVEYSGTPYGTFKKARKRSPVKQAVPLAPVVPSQIVAVGLIYRDHTEEMRVTARDLQLRAGQATSAKAFIFPVEDVIARVSAVMTLVPDDMIATGTLAGVGPLEPGDRVEVRIDGIDTLKNPVIKLQEA